MHSSNRISHKQGNNNKKPTKWVPTKHIRDSIKRKTDDVPNGSVLFFVFAPVQTDIWN